MNVTALWGNGAGVLALLGTGTLPPGVILGVVLSVLDTRGRVLNSVTHTDLDLSATARPDIMPVADGVAIVFAEAFARLGRSRPVKIFATDSLIAVADARLKPSGLLSNR